jgi:hypothetical protein
MPFLVSCFHPTLRVKEARGANESRRRHVVTALSFSLSLSVRGAPTAGPPHRVRPSISPRCTVPSEHILRVCTPHEIPPNERRFLASRLALLRLGALGRLCTTPNQQRPVIRDYSSAPTAPFNPQSSPMCSACPPAARRELRECLLFVFHHYCRAPASFYCSLTQPCFPAVRCYQTLSTMQHTERHPSRVAWHTAEDQYTRMSSH